ncbi:hypothetical protein FisN_1Hh150 [Fistulifera solaris]|uniref:Uncharacterized protein n=1 Tax=Fistulifera solaris TaxID=1519565 RepID=A0A1Z5JEN5_FISSO|nr:hypothetical protein FisN_1Hh150 [Fistulifera solaris]|eukprot:GAX12221.1 hypothetical protein FisN_1Hh150 [Fistulifera solaris]
MHVVANTYDETFFNNWMDTLKKSLVTRLPQPDPAFTSACKSVNLCQQALSSAQSVLADIEKNYPNDKALLEKAKALVEKESKVLDEATKVCQTTAKSVFEQDLMQILLSDKNDDSDLVTFTVLKQAGAKKLASWCTRGQTETSELMDFLKDPAQIRLYLQAGGARNGEYGRAVQIHRQLTRSFPHPTNDVITRLALAVALELCSPLTRFGTTQLIDPIQRYIHYEQAYLFGELDPAFQHFQVWELRGVVDSDASNEELGWGRECLLNFRPDIAFSNDPKWRYCEIVRSDVTYKAPEWYKSPRSYDQILSGGGKCGPRAWYGRFICKAFGIPTWGVKQVGHAAMSRWTTKGWTTCLGADFKWTYWEGRSGLDFQLETQARYTLNNSESTYLEKVARLELIGYLNDEDTRSIRMQLIPTASAYWTSLALFQRKILRDVQQSLPTQYFATSRTAKSIQHLRGYPRGNVMVGADILNGTVIIPAAPTCYPPNETKTIKFLDSILGGKQLLMIGSGYITYGLPLDGLSQSREYSLQLRVCTVHRHEEPFAVTITSFTANGDVKDEQQASIDIPYTMGMWDETKPVLVTFGGFESVSVQLKITRQSSQGLSIKEIKLVPFKE